MLSFVPLQILERANFCVLKHRSAGGNYGNDVTDDDPGDGS